jgi:hypothetical protein
MKEVLITLLLAAVFVLTGCANEESRSQEPIQENPEPSEQEDDQHQEDQSTERDEVEDSLGPEETADKIVQLLKNKEMEVLAELVHSSEGVRFSPYGYIDKENDQVFTSEQVKKLWEDETVYHWGQFDGSGDPIKMTFPEYYDRFVYDHDYVNAEETSVNKRLGQGNTINNSQEVYPNATIIEYHFSGFEEEYEGMDWRSLRLVMEKEKEKWFLIGIIHDEWTT